MEYAKQNNRTNKQRNKHLKGTLKTIKSNQHQKNSFLLSESHVALATLPLLPRF